MKVGNQAFFKTRFDMFRIERLAKPSSTGRVEKQGSWKKEEEIGGGEEACFKHLYVQYKKSKEVPKCTGLFLLD